MTRRQRVDRLPRRVALVASLLLLVVQPSAAQRGEATRAASVYEASIRELQDDMAAGRTTSVALVAAYLARIRAYDRAGPDLNALIRLNPRARDEAAALDRERRAGKVRGPLHGIPVILKDNYGTADLPTTGGSLALAGLQPGDDALVVQRLRDAGAVILAKANLHELAAGVTTISSLGGQTRNPYDLSRCPGGSSGGTAVAVAASFAAVGWGSDTCGSIRMPAAYNNLFGLRPTQGLTSRSGIIPLSHSQDVLGPLARSMTDLAIALDVTVGFDSADPGTAVLRDRPLPRFVDSLDASALKGARLGVLLNYFRAADAEIADTVRAAIASMKAAGATIVDVDIPSLDSLIEGSSVIDFELKFDLMSYLDGISQPPVRTLRDILDRGLYHAALETVLRRRDTVSAPDGPGYQRARSKQAVLRARLLAVLDSVRIDALIYPTMGQRPAIIGQPQAGGTCQLSAHTGFPALSAPAGLTPDGLPVGVELLGRPFADWRLVALAYSLERLGSRRRPPPTTPPLIDGTAPYPVASSVTTRAGLAVARLRFTYDAPRSELSWKVQVTGVTPDRVHAVVLQRLDPGTVRVSSRLSGPGITRASGKLYLNGVDRRALLEGRLALLLATSDAVSDPGVAKLAIH